MHGAGLLLRSMVDVIGRGTCSGKPLDSLPPSALSEALRSTLTAVSLGTLSQASSNPAVTTLFTKPTQAFSQDPTDVGTGSDCETGSQGPMGGWCQEAGTRLGSGVMWSLEGKEGVMLEGWQGEESTGGPASLFSLVRFPEVCQVCAVSGTLLL